MWSHSTSEGRAKYGPEFIGMDSFVSVHADQSTGDIKVFTYYPVENKEKDMH